jgi:hypothetical protein
MDPLQCLAFLDFPHRPYHLATDSSGQVIAACSPEGIIILLSATLGVLGSFDRDARG